MIELDEEHRGLNRVEPVVERPERTLIAITKAMIPSHSKVFGKLGIVGRDDPAIAHRVQRFEGMKAETSGDTLTDGAIILDKHNLKVDSDAPDGEYVVNVTVLDPITEKKLHRIAEDGRRVGTELELARVRIDSGT